MTPLANIDAIKQFIQNYLQTQNFHAQSSHAVSEYTLIKLLDEAKLFASLPTKDPTLLLFQKHFLCMHTLYVLQDVFYQQKLSLQINPLAIYLAPTTAPADNASVEHHNNFRAYYLDLKILEQATSESVHELQENFYKRYQNWLVADDAYDILKLSKTASWQQIQKQYRRLAQDAHPDKGGDSAWFQQLTEAYNKLKTRHSG